MKNFRFVSLVILLATLVCCGLVCCGGSSSLSGKYEVNDVHVLAKDINVGESTRTEVFFQTRTEFDGTPNAVDVVVKMSPSLVFIEGTSRIYDSSTDNSDPREPDRVIHCTGGGEILIYRFQDYELRDRPISGDDEFGLKYEMLGVSKDPVAIVAAEAFEDASSTLSNFTCDTSFNAEEDETITVR